MDFPPVTIVMTTYFPSGHPERISTAQKTKATWEDRLKYDGPLYLHIADDGSPIDPDHDSFLGLAQSGHIWFKDTISTFSQQNRHGVGASLNHGFKLAFVQSPIVAAFMDDWSLTREVNLTPWVHLLMQREDIGMVRLGPCHPGVTGTVEVFTELWEGWGLRLDRHHFAFGHRPALYHRRLIDKYGWFAEDCNAYVCEKKYNAAFCQNKDGPDIVLALPNPWFHIDSVELADLDPTNRFGDER